MSIDLKKLLSTTPETLAERQHEALLREVQSTFSRIVNHLQKGEFDQANAMLGDSPAGDGHGCDNRCIKFDHVLDPVPGCFTDIGEVIAKLETLVKFKAKHK